MACVRLHMRLVLVCAILGGVLGLVLTPNIYTATFMIYEPLPGTPLSQSSQSPPFVVSVARKVARYLDKAAVAMGRTNIALEQGVDKLIEQQTK